MTEEKKIYTIGTLSDSLKVNRPDLIRYASCYNIDLKSFCKKQQDYIGRYLELYEEGFEFLLSRKEEIQNFRTDFFTSKSVDELCTVLEFDLTEFVEFYNLHRQTISSHGYSLWPEFKPSKKLSKTSTIHNISTQLLIHLKTEFPAKISKGNISDGVDRPNDNQVFNNIIGYDDFKSTVIDQLHPIVDSKALDLWGLRPPGGIILFGPPGCGKTFWAQQIAEYLKFQFLELPRSVFASSLVDGAVTKLKEILDGIEPRTVIFFDEFDSVAEKRSNASNGSRENVKIVNTLLQEIPKLIKKEVIILAATNFMSRIDSAVIRPGRFDLKIPIFPPNPKERAEIIYFKLTKNLNSKSPLIEILKINKVLSADFFAAYTDQMKLFSSSLLEDFVDTLKRSLKLSFESGQKLSDIKIDEKRVTEVITKTTAKLVNQDLEFLANFYLEVSSFAGAKLYQERLNQLKKELEGKFKGKKDPPRPIGYRMPKLEE